MDLLTKILFSCTPRMHVGHRLPVAVPLLLRLRTGDVAPVVGHGLVGRAKQAKAIQEPLNLCGYRRRKKREKEFIGRQTERKEPVIIWESHQLKLHYQAKLQIRSTCLRALQSWPFCPLLNILWVLNMQPFVMLHWAHILYHLKPVRYLLNLFLSPSKHIKEGQIPDVRLMKHQINKETITKQVADLQDSVENSGFDSRKTRMWTPVGRKTLLENTALCRWRGNLCKWRIFHIENAE